MPDVQPCGAQVAVRFVRSVGCLLRVFGRYVMADLVNEPPHYRWLPNGVEAIDITENFNFNLGNCLKYVIRSRHKGAHLQDLKKARWYLDREIHRIERNSNCDTDD